MPGALSWHRKRGRVLIDLHSEIWREFLASSGMSAEAAAEHVERAAAAGRARRIGRGTYVIVEEGRPVDIVAVASQLFDAHPHYITTDGALRHHALTEQPIHTYRVVVPSTVRRLRKGVRIGQQTIRPVNLSLQQLESSSYAKTLTAASNSASVAEPEQAIADVLAYPRWSDLFDLIPEFLTTINSRVIDRAAELALRRSKAAGQRLGYLLESIGAPIPHSITQIERAKGVQFDPRHPGEAFSNRWSLWVPG